MNRNSIDIACLLEGVQLGKGDRLVAECHLRAADTAAELICRVAESVWHIAATLSKSVGMHLGNPNAGADHGH